MLKGSDRRQFMGSVVNLIGRGGQCFAEEILGWNRVTVRKGQTELLSGTTFENRFSARGRRRIEERLPHLLDDICSIVEPSGQTDPTFRSTRIYSPLSADEVRLRLIAQRGYSDTELPCTRTLRNKLNDLGYQLRKVRKCLPLKKIPKTDAIFEEVHQVNHVADQDDGILRISLDTKAAVKVGPFSRGGYSRQGERAWDHDFQPEATLTPFGILLPKTGDNHLWFSQSKVTADFMVDRLEEMMPQWKKRFALHTLLINADNGPESSGRRTQWLKRLVELSDAHQLTIQLAYYPPYHSKYNPVERLWGVLENHWQGELIDSIDKALGLARSMTYRGIKPTVRKVTKSYRKGVTVAKRAMLDIESRLERTTDLEHWFIKIAPQPQTG
ncbi:MAG: ISAzo13 family transposase [gamma proteobacterium endosymbiont of Lamellibrachia anaximandri]|nr:ISAzo13 family transposase [gamma proteobacterium endosymbiont of Lamellibrachia anaximandri]